MTIRIEPLLIRLSFTFLTFSPWNLAVWAGSCRWRLWVTSRYPRLSSGCRREDPGPALHRNDDLNDQDQEIYRCAADLEAQQWRPGAARHELEQRPLLVLAQPRHHLDQSEVSILVTDQSERGILAHLPERWDGRVAQLVAASVVGVGLNIRQYLYESL